jgi:hypothetical protein
MRDKRRGDDPGGVASAPPASTAGKRSLSEQLPRGSGEATAGGAGNVGLPTGNVGLPAATPMTNAAKVTHEAGYDAAQGAKDRTKFGVGEVAYLAAEIAGTWTASAATGATTHKGDSYDWTAPDTAQKVTITFDPGGGAPVTTVHFEVVAPDIKFSKIDDVTTYRPGTMGAGMNCNVNFLPYDVSFGGHVAWKEDNVPGVNAKDYFEHHDLPEHVANPAWKEFNNNNTGPKDFADFSKFPKPWSAGSFEWLIPQNYRVGSGPKHLIRNVTQRCDLEGDDHAGRTTVTKDITEQSTRDP